MNDVEKDLVWLPDAMLELRLSREQAMRRIHIGELEGGKLGGRWYVRRASLDQWLRERADGGRRAPAIVGGEG